MALCVLSQAAAAARERRAEAEARAAAEDAERARAEESALTDEQRQARACAPARFGGRACLRACLFVFVCLFVLVSQARQLAEADRLRGRKLAEFQARRIARHAELERRDAGHRFLQALAFTCVRACACVCLRACKYK